MHLNENSTYVRVLAFHRDADGDLVGSGQMYIAHTLKFVPVLFDGSLEQTIDSVQEFGRRYDHLWRTEHEDDPQQGALPF